MLDIALAKAKTKADLVGPGYYNWPSQARAFNPLGQYGYHFEALIKADLLTHVPN